MTLLSVPALALSLMAASPPAGTLVPEILVSRHLLDDEGLAVGDVVLLSPRRDGGDARRFRIAGVHEPVPDPMRFAARRLEVRLHLPDLLEMTADSADPLSPETVTAINVRLREPEREDAFTAALDTRSYGLAVLPTRQPEGSNPFETLERFHLAIAAVTVLGSTAFLLALMVMRAEERREVAGTLRLVGFRRRRVLLLVLLEGFVLACLGAVAGVLFASATQGFVNAFFQWRYDTPLVFVRVTRAIALECILLSVPLGVLAGVIASWAILRGNVVELLRR